MSQEPNAHCQTWELIPWVVNGTATAQQRERVAQHLRDCADCRAEFEQQRRFSAAMQMDAPPVHDAQPALARLLARVDLEDGRVAAAPAIRRRSRSTPWLAAAVVIQAIGLGLLGAAQLNRPGVSPDAAYRTLSGASAQATATQIRLVAAPDMTLATLREMLGESGLRIVESNAGNNIFGLAAVDATKATSDEFVFAALVQLRARPGVLLAEPVVRAARAP